MNASRDLSPWACLLLCLMATALLTANIRKGYQERRQEQLRVLSDDVRSALKGELHLYESLLTGGAALHRSSSTVSPPEWAHFARELGWEDRFPGSAGFFTAEYIPANEGVSFTHQVHRETPGADLNQDRDLRNLLSGALDEERSHLRIIPFTGKDQYDNLLFCLPFDLEGRRHHWVGFIIRSDDFFKNALRRYLPSRQKLFDMQVLDSDKLLFGHRLKPGRHSESFELDRFDRKWKVSLSLSDTVKESSPGDNSTIVALAGLAASFMLFGIFKNFREESRLTITLIEKMRRDLENQCRKLEVKNHDLDAFAYVASHDLKAPLRAIDNLTSWVTEDCAGLLPEREKTHLSTIRARVDEMGRLLNGLLDFSRIGRMQSPPDLVDTERTLRGVSRELEMPDDTELILETPLPRLFVSPSLMEKIFSAILANSVKYRSASPLVIKVRCRFVEEGAYFEFEDNGRGIDDIILAKVFELFHKTSGATEPRRRVRLGLAIAKKCVRQLGGEIKLTTIKGQGTTVAFRVPMDSVLPG